MSEHDLLILGANLVLGVLLGSVGGMMGIGGGLIAIPVLSWLYGMDQQLAQGTALVMIAPNVLVGFIRYRQRNPINLRSTASLAVLAMISTWLAARYASGLNPSHLRIGFAVFLLVLAAYFVWQLRPRPEAPPKKSLHPRYMPIMGVLSGVMSGMFSVGGGLVVVPALVSFFRKTQTQAQGIAMALVLPGSLVALFTYSHAGHVAWATGIPLAVGGILSVSWGVALAHRMPERRLRAMFCLVLFLTAIGSLLQH